MYDFLCGKIIFFVEKIELPNAKSIQKGAYRNIDTFIDNGILEYQTDNEIFQYSPTLNKSFPSI